MDESKRKIDHDIVNEFVLDPLNTGSKKPKAEALIQDYGLQDLVKRVEEATRRAVLYSELETDEERSKFLRKELGPTPLDPAMTEEELAAKKEQKRLKKEERARQIEENQEEARRKERVRTKAEDDARKQERIKFENEWKAKLVAAEKVLWDNLPEHEKAYRLEQKARIDAEREAKDKEFWDTLPDDVRANWSSLSATDQNWILRSRSYGNTSQPTNSGFFDSSTSGVICAGVIGICAITISTTICIFALRVAIKSLTKQALHTVV